ncbi:MAG: hypothetical protein M3R13_09190 [Armatimonadota bacterium]|nr:hypothetical protein [Armatimonadota bacterium]
MTLGTRWGTTFAAAILVAGAYAQWTATELDGFAARGIAEGEVVGESVAFRALLWDSTLNLVSLHPPLANFSYAYGTDGQQQAGETRGPSGLRAALWEGNAASWVDLHPAGATRSVANGVHSSEQVGWAVFSGVQRAGLWTGDPASWTDLNPAGATRSLGEGVHSGHQVGSAMFGGIYHAGFWSGTAASWVDLHPVDASESIAYGVYENRQVGFATFIGDRASLWSGTSESWVNLHPAGASASIAYGIFDSSQVGYVTFDGFDHAAFWRGTAESFVDLHASVDPKYVDSWAYGVWKDTSEGKTYAVGRAYDGQNSVAMIWTLLPAEINPHTFNLIRGNVGSGGLSSVFESDNVRLVVKPGIVFSIGQSPLVMEFVGTATTVPLSALTLFVENSASSSSIEIRIEMYDYDAPGYVLVQTQQSTMSDHVFRIDRSDANRFVGQGGEVKCRLTYKATGPLFAFPWTANVDWVRWRAAE